MVTFILAQADQKSSLATLSGKVVDVTGAGVKGATVIVEGQNLKALTSGDGTFKISGVMPGNIYLYVKAPSKVYLDGETLNAISVKAGTSVADVSITLSGRPSDSAAYVGMKACIGCHADYEKFFDGTPNASVHSRFVTEGTSHMVYPNLWPKPGDKYLPRDEKGNLLMVQDPRDGKGMVNVVLCTRGEGNKREYLFKFYPEQKNGASLKESELDCSASPLEALWIPVAGTIGGEGNWGKGYVDPEHKTPDRYPNFGEGKQRFLARIQDIPYRVKFYNDHNIPLNKGKQNYAPFLPVYIMQDGTPQGSKVLAKGEVGFPSFWLKSPKNWAEPTITLAAECAGCHATGAKVEYKKVGEKEVIVTSWDYVDLNITCEKCHGPGSDHVNTGDKRKIISPRYLTAKAQNDLCGYCHATHDGKSANPKGVFKQGYNEAYKNSIGYGFFVPGIYNLEDFYYNLCKPSTALVYGGDWKEGTFHTWPDQTHGRAHSMEYCEIARSKHWDNGERKLTCSSCHDPHSLDAGPAKLTAGDYTFVNAAYGNNTLCLVCHAGKGSFKEVTKADVAVLQVDAGRKVTKNGTPFSTTPSDAALARNRVARSVAKHMQVGAGMGGALYTPDDPKKPVGNCASCHMPKIGKLQDVNVDAQYHLDFDKNGKSAIAEGNVPSHVFDIVWPAQSAVLKKRDASKGRDVDIMPNSCSKCHDFARTSGDKD